MLEFSRFHNPIKQLADSERLADRKQVAGHKQVVGKISLNTAGDLPQVPVETDIATVEYDIDHSPFLRVRFQGVSWRARCNQSFSYELGMKVRVVCRQGNTLIIEAITQL